jgi:primosomal protein N' (replication factor Y)
MYAQVIFPVAAPGIYQYSVPKHLQKAVKTGVRIYAELKNKKMWGFVCAVAATTELKNVKQILKADSETFLLTRAYLTFLDWLWTYYRAYPGDVLRAAVTRPVERLLEKSMDRQQISKTVPDTSALKMAPLTSAQQSAFKPILESLKSGGHQTFLLQGITSSGKSHIYYELVKEALKKGKGVLMMVPEIALTPQTVRNFTRIFKDRVAVFHSRLSEKEKAENWFHIYKGTKDVVIGVRSALFTPVKNLGLVIVDEEHDGSYCQSERNFNFNGRDAAVMRSKIEGAVVVLGSATPSLESRYNADRGKYRLLTLDERYNRQPLPVVYMVNMKTEREKNNWSIFSHLMLEKIQDRLHRKEQVILLKNRRGFANFLQCGECGYIPVCPNCNISLTYHRAIKRMVCHYCNRRETPPQACPQCEGTKIKFSGSGVEKVEDELKKVFPEVRTLRLDLDTGSRRGRVETILNAFWEKKADVLIGTQMVSKGLDFSNVTLVGVVLADTGLFFPDFHASERTFQLLTQVAGRSGRRGIRGEVVLQTYAPDEKSIKYAVDQDYNGFYREELNSRLSLDFPPALRGVLIRFISRSESASAKACRNFHTCLTGEKDIHILGPTPALLYKIRNTYRYFIYIKSKSSGKLHSAVDHAFQRYGPPRQGKVKVQVVFDPDSLL